MSPVEPEPPEPTPRQILVVAEHIAAGWDDLRAALVANVYPASLSRIRDGEEFEAILAACRAAQAKPAAEREATLRRLIHRAVEQALADGRVGAFPTAMRLLEPPRPLRDRGADPGAAVDDDGGDDETAAEEALAEATLARWGMRSDGRGGWLAPDGGPVIPDREVYVVPAADGPVRLLDTDPAAAPAAYLAVLDAMDEAGADTFNRGAYPHGGPQWDRRTRTYWRWIRPADRPQPTGPDSPTKAAKPSAGKPAPGREALAPLSAPPAPPPPTPMQRLRARLDRLLAHGGAPADADELDLAEAVCARVWPNWPRYEGSIDTAALGDLLAARPLDPGQLARLGGSGGGPAPGGARGPPR